MEKRRQFPFRVFLQDSRYLTAIWLKKAGLVTSLRGAQGGYRLAKPAEEISVGDVLRALEGSIEAVSCQEGENPSCVGKDLCVARYVWQKVNKSIQETVDSIMISQLVEESRRIQENQR